MRITFVSLFILFSVAVFSQSDNTNSPYTRYGYGVLADQTFASQRGMGGIGYGLRNSQLINPLNPASFSAVDSMTFMLDFGIKGQVAMMNDSAFGTSRRYNGGLEYLAIQIPLAKGLGIGVGIEPVSFVGYQYGDTTHRLDAVAYEVYQGSGGLNKVYSNLSYKLFNRLSLGVNIGYLFGDIVHDRSANFTTDAYTVSWIDSLSINSLTYEAGLQYIQKLTKNSELVFGVVYSPKITVNANVKAAEVRYDNQTGQVTGDPNYYSTHDSIFQLPETYGIGLTYHKNNKLIIGADLQYQKWTDTKYQYYKWADSKSYHDMTGSLANRMKINVGGEYIPNVMKNNLFSKIHYRVGASFANSYIVDKHESRYDEYGVSVGLGIPMVDRRSFINMAFEYSRLTPQKTASMNEQYFKFTLSYTFNEPWFFKRKLQ
ncbi:membrane protein [Bacteroidia bacterium]|nr:membrane protein [Bacteroidia bacterium]